LLSRITTPAKPISRPRTFGTVILSSCNKRWAITIVNNGVVALRIDATAESIVCSPHEMKKMGMARLAGPRMAKILHVFQSRGHVTFWVMPMATPLKAPNNMRKAVSAIGPISCTPILIHRKDELQIRPSVMKTNQCLGFKGCSW
jgi:hypothetical protein